MAWSPRARFCPGTAARYGRNGPTRTGLTAGRLLSEEIWSNQIAQVLARLAAELLTDIRAVSVWVNALER
jgi:hypothetical protein